MTTWFLVLVYVSYTPSRQNLVIIPQDYRVEAICKADGEAAAKQGFDHYFCVAHQ